MVRQGCGWERLGVPVWFGYGWARPGVPEGLLELVKASFHDLVVTWLG